MLYIYIISPCMVVLIKASKWRGLKVFVIFFTYLKCYFSLGKAVPGPGQFPGGAGSCPATFKFLYIL